MIFRALILFVAAGGVAGCAKKTMELSGFDGRLVDPVVQQQYTVECQGRAAVAGGAVTFAGSTLARAVEQGQVQQAAFEGCMAEKGVKVSWRVEQT